uniref:Uncharacterized protein n=1 Tax=Anguilla anguilla TaxID=7936 RepID=A0A0E9PRY8_ANGAN
MDRRGRTASVNSGIGPPGIKTHVPERSAMTSSRATTPIGVLITIHKTL